MLDRLLTLQRTKGQFANGGELSKALDTDHVLRNEINLLTKVFLNRTLSGCNSCYMDAYFELLTVSQEKALQIMETKDMNFTLRAGALLMDYDDMSKNMTNANISMDLSLYHLRKNPSCRKLFTKLPENIDQLIAGTNEQKPKEEAQLSPLAIELKSLIDGGMPKTKARTAVKTDVLTYKVIDAALAELKS